MLARKIIATVLAIVLALSCSFSSFADSQREQTSFANDPIAISSKSLNYEDYFRNEHGFYLDNSSRITNIFSLYSETGSLLFANQNNSAYYNGQPVTGYVGNQELLFFCVNHTIYRYHVLSKKVDQLFYEADMVSFYPVTSEKILWGSNFDHARSNPICSSSIEEEITYHLYDTYSNSAISTFDPVELIRMTTCGPYVNLRDATRYNINGKAIPHTSYPAGSTWGRKPMRRICSIHLLLSVGQLWNCLLSVRHCNYLHQYQSC